MSSKQQVLIINRSNPELNHLAAALFNKGFLLKIVRPYYYGGRIVEKLLATLLPRTLTTSTFMRRQMPAGLGQEKIVEAGVFEDMLMMSLVRVIGRYPSGSTFLPGLLPVLDTRIYKRLVEKAEQIFPQATYIVGTEGLGLAGIRNQAKIILNAPLIHPDSIIYYMAEHDLKPVSTEAELRRVKLSDIEISDQVLVGSQFARSTYLEHGVPGEKITVVPFGVDQELFKIIREPEPQQSIFRIMYAGRFVFQKGIDTLIRAFAGFGCKDAEMVMAGSMTKYGQEIIGATKGICLTGQLSQLQLAELFRQSHVFVFPTRYEGMGLTVLQAMACGLPVITTDRGPGSVVRDGVDGFIVPVDSPDAIIEKLKYFYQHPAERIRMGENACRRARLFSWDNYASAAIDAIFTGKESHPGLAKNEKK